MPNIPPPQRQDEPVLTDADLAALLAGTTDVAPGLRPVADILTALTAEATAMELAGEYRARAEFRRRAGGVPGHHARRGSAGLTSRFGVKIGASIAAATVVLGGGAAAAFADALPAPIQRLAHDAIGAPIPQGQREAPRHSRSVVYGQMVQGPPVARRSTAARGGPDTKRQLRPHATATPTPQAKGRQHANPQGNGSPGQQGGQGSGQGRQGDGQGQSHGRTGEGQGSSHGHGSSPGSSQGSSGTHVHGTGQVQQWAGHHGWGQHRSRHHMGLHGSPRANWRLAWHPRRFIPIRWFMGF